MSEHYEYTVMDPEETPTGASTTMGPSGAQDFIDNGDWEAAEDFNGDWIEDPENPGEPLR